MLDAPARRGGAQHGLTFGPDPSSHSRCTLGGMIGNDACGNHSVRYGRTSEPRRVAGDRARPTACGPWPTSRACTPLDPADADRVAAPRSETLRGIVGAEPRRRSAPSWAASPVRSPATSSTTCCPSTVSTWPAHSWAPRAPAWSITEATRAAGARSRPLRRCSPSATTTSSTPPRTCRTILAHEPAAVEGIDEAIVATMRHRRGADAVVGLPEGRAWLYVELDGDDAADGRRRARPNCSPSCAAAGPAGRRAGGADAGRAALAVAGPRGRRRAGRPGWSAARSPGPAGRTRPSPPRTWPPTCATSATCWPRTASPACCTGTSARAASTSRIDFDIATTDGVAAMRRFLRGRGAPGGRARRHALRRARRRPGARRAADRHVQRAACWPRSPPSSAPSTRRTCSTPACIVAPAPLDADLSQLHPPRREDWRTAVRLPARRARASPGRPTGASAWASAAPTTAASCARATGPPATRSDSTRGRARALQEMVRGDHDHRRLALHRGPRRAGPLPVLQGLFGGLPGRRGHGHLQGRVPAPPLQGPAPAALALLAWLAARGCGARRCRRPAGERPDARQVGSGDRPARGRRPGTGGCRGSPAVAHCAAVLRERADGAATGRGAVPGQLHRAFRPRWPGRPRGCWQRPGSAASRARAVLRPDLGEHRAARRRQADHATHRAARSTATTGRSSCPSRAAPPRLRSDAARTARHRRCPPGRGHGCTASPAR